ncbi:MAG TPA: response regulator transcription factor [Terriglobia bacterium]|nr:response regulator transcription factor [Terriglobia bacterium]
MSKIRILIADDHEVFRKGLKTMLEARPDWNICGEASTGRAAVEAVRELNPDIVIMDISMPELNGIEATRQILKIAPKTDVLVLSMHDSEELVREMVEVGVRGYLLKSDAGRVLMSAIEALVRHEPFFSSKVSDHILQGYREADIPTERSRGPRTRLSAREREIVQFLVEGKTNKEVAASLGISVRTIETHRANIMRKLNMTSLSELVRFAIRNKIISA